MVLKNGVKSIQTAGYNGARTVYQNVNELEFELSRMWMKQQYGCMVI